MPDYVKVLFDRIEAVAELCRRGIDLSERRGLVLATRSVARVAGGFVRHALGESPPTRPGASPCVNAAGRCAAARGETSGCIRRAMHPRGLRCDSLKYRRYYRSLRLFRGAPRPSRCDARLSPRPARGRVRRPDRGARRRASPHAGWLSALRPHMGERYCPSRAGCSVSDRACRR